MAHSRLRTTIGQSGLFAALALVSTAAALACAPSSGTGTEPTMLLAGQGGGHPQGANGAGAPAAGTSGVPQGGTSGVPNGGAPGGFGNNGGIVGNGGIGPGNGGFFPGDGGAQPGDGGMWGNTGGLPPGAAGTCGTNTVDPSTYPSCTTCQGGRCVPTSELVGAPVELLAACDGTSACVPEQIVAQADNLLLRSCSSIGGSEGRCTSLCIPAASNLAAYLPQDLCAPTERCVPCYSPNDGVALGICGLGCDPGATGAPFIFGTCCGGAGRCAPKSAIPSATAANLGSETCPSSDLCVPGGPINNPNYRFPCCTTTIAAVSVTGICAPACVIDQGSQGKLLTQASCNGGEKCVPCKNPLTGAPTNACTDLQGQVTNTCVP